jgi:riboflavin-specific deaminase-like protein
MTRPTVLLNFAITADGKISTVSKEPARFTSKADLRRLHQIRMRADAVLVGRGTLEADQMTITVPAEFRPTRQPLRCIVSSAGTFDLGHKVFHTPGGAVHLLVTEAPADYNASRYEAAGACVHRQSLAGFLATLADIFGVETLLCEGGGTLARALAELDAIDEINLTWAGHTLSGGADAPTITGHLGPHLSPSLQFELTHFEPLDNGECFLTYQRNRTEN